MKLTVAWRIMRLTTLFILITALHLSAKTTAQKVTLSSSGITISQFFDQLNKQTGFSFLLEDGTVSTDQKIEVHVTEMSLEDVLDQILKPLSLSYTIDHKMVMIHKTEAPVSVLKVEEVPPIDIHGHITDSLGNPLVGASVTIKGSKKGTSTNARGEFILQNVPQEAILIVSYTGYDSKNFKVAGVSSFTITLIRSASLLDQIQVIAYGTTTQRLATGDVSTVTSEQIERQPIVNPIFAMEGLVPGISIQQTSGISGAGYNVQIRGQSSIGNGSAPLYVVDGVPYISGQIGILPTNGGITGNADLANPLNYINPLDIESISVLKDADATAIYGSRGANGVVLVTTKKGGSGNTKVNINLFGGGSQVTRTMKMMNTQQYLQMRREAFSNDGVTPTITNAPDLLAWDTTKYTDWQKKLIGGTAQILNAQVSVSGGNKNTQYLISGNYHQEGTVYPGNFSDKRGSFHLNLNNTSDNGKFRTAISVNYLNDNNTTPGSDPSYQLSLPPDLPDVIDSKGQLLWPPSVSINPYALLKSQYTSATNNLIGKVSFAYKIIPQLDLAVDMGYGSIYINEISTNPIAGHNPANGIGTGYTQFTNSQIGNWNVEPQIRWNKSFSFGTLNVVAGTTVQQSLQQGTNIYGTGYTNDALLNDISSAGSIITEPSYYVLYRYAAFFGRINYNYKDKYILNFSGRRDGSSRFGPGKQFSNFGSVGGAWIFSNEEFSKEDLSFLSFGKIRANYGISGNDVIPDYGFMELYKPVGPTFLGTPALYPTNLANANYSWERDKKFELGINLGFIKDRIILGASWYQNRTDNQLVGLPLPASVGYSSIQANLPATVQNTGVEINLNTVNIKTASINWTSYFNISVPRNKLISYPNLAQSVYATQLIVGKSLYTQPLFHSLGVDPKTGIYIFQDVDGSGTGTDYPGDLQGLKQIARDFDGGFENNVRYKSFELDFLFQFVKQTGQSPIFNTNSILPGMMANQSVVVLNHWQKQGDVARYQQYSTGDGNGSNAYLAYIYSSFISDSRIVDASFIRLKNVALQYHLPTSWLQSVKMDQATIYIQGQNLWTMTSYIGGDPESQYFGGLPPLKSIVAGIKLTF